MSFQGWKLVIKMKHRSLKINAILNGIKQCCTILFPLITFPYVSRVLGSEGYGKYSFAQSVTSYFVLIASLGINTYAIREGAKIREYEKEVTEFCSQVFSINVLSAVFSYICLIITLILSTKIGGYSPYILVQSIAIFMATIGTNWINSIYEDYLYLTIRYIAVQFIALICMFIFVKNPNDVIPYCIIALLATNGGDLINVFYVRKYIHVKFTFHIELKKHIIPMLILFANSVAITIYVSSDITMLGFFADDVTVGIYSFASKIYNILKQLVNAVIVVTLPRVSYVIKNNKEKYEYYINMIFSAVNLILFPIAVGTFFMSDTMILIAGGMQYLSGGYALKILSVATLFAIYASIFTNCILIVNKQEDKCLKSTIISAIVNVALNFILIPLLGMIGAAITTVLAELVNCFMQISYSKDYFDWHKLPLKNSISCIIGGTTIAIVCICVNHFIIGAVLRMTLSITISSVLYLFILILFKNEIVIEAVNKIKAKLHTRGINCE